MLHYSNGIEVIYVTVLGDYSSEELAPARAWQGFSDASRLCSQAFHHRELAWTPIDIDDWLPYSIGSRDKHCLWKALFSENCAAMGRRRRANDVRYPTVFEKYRGVK